MLGTTHGVLDPNLGKAVESQTLHVRDGRVRQDRGLGGSDLSSGGVLIAGRDGLGRSQSQCANKGGQSLLSEHDFELGILSLPIVNNTVDAKRKKKGSARHSTQSYTWRKECGEPVGHKVRTRDPLFAYKLGGAAAKTPALPRTPGTGDMVQHVVFRG